MVAKNKFRELFGKKIPILGMIHLGGENRVERALEEIEIYENEDVDGAIIENYHGSYFDVVSTLEKISENKHKIIIGINILPNEYKDAFQLAKRHAKFIQLDYVAGRYGPWDGDIREIDATDYLENRDYYSDTVVLGGVWPKYYHPISGSNLENDIKDGMQRTDAIVVTGSGTGIETPMDKIQNYRKLLNNFPLVIGAGLNSENVFEQLKIADGAIVGSCFKPNSNTRSKVDRKLVEEFMEQVNKARDYRKEI